MIEVQDLSKRYGDKLAVNHLSFTVEPGTVTGFLGPNGAGKSTTMRLIVGLDHPTAGTATIDGRRYAELHQPLRVVGALLEAGALHPGRSAHNHLLFLAQTQALPKRRVDEVIDLVGLHDVARERVGGFSLGMRQRMGIAAALLGDPRVLILDEPASDLDPRARIELRMLLTELARMGKTIFLSSHILTELADICSHVGIIEAGRVVAHGPIDAVQAARRPGRRVTLTVLGHADRVEASVKRFTFVQSVTALGEPEEAGPRRFELSFEGDDWRLSELVAAVVAAGVPVVAVEPERRDLERLFMDLTVGAQGNPTEGG